MYICKYIYIYIGLSPFPVIVTTRGCYIFTGESLEPWRPFFYHCYWEEGKLNTCVYETNIYQNMYIYIYKLYIYMYTYVSPTHTQLITTLTKDLPINHMPCPNISEHSRWTMNQETVFEITALSRCLGRNH